MDEKLSDLLHYKPRNKDKTLYISNIDNRVSKSLLYELLIQTSPIVNLHYPQDYISKEHYGYCFAEYPTLEDAIYSLNTLNLTRLFNKPLRFSKLKSENNIKLFVGNLSNSIDEKMLYDIFSKFGGCECRIVRDDEGKSKGYGFIAFSKYSESDIAIEKVNGRNICNCIVVVEYALKKDGSNEKYGSEEDRKAQFDNN